MDQLGNNVHTEYANMATDSPITVQQVSTEMEMPINTDEHMEPKEESKDDVLHSSEPTIITIDAAVIIRNMQSGI